jgi:hypothetical protein
MLISYKPEQNMSTQNQYELRMQVTSESRLSHIKLTQWGKLSTNRAVHDLDNRKKENTSQLQVKTNNRVFSIAKAAHPKWHGVTSYMHMHYAGACNGAML